MSFAILPDCYIAKSIADFLESKDNIPAPLTWKATDFLLNGKARTSVMIDFSDVKLKSFEVSGIKAVWTLNDGRNELVLYPRYPECNPEEMKRYADGNYKTVRAFYVPGHNRLHLVRADGFQGAVNEEGTHADLEKRILNGETVLANGDFKAA